MLENVGLSAGAGEDAEDEEARRGEGIAVPLSLVKRGGRAGAEEST